MKAPLPVIVSVVLAACAQPKPVAFPGPESEGQYRELVERIDQLTQRIDRLDATGSSKRSTGAEKSALAEGLSEVMERLSELEERVADLAAPPMVGPSPAPAPSPPRHARPRPDPALTYAVPIAGNPYVGPKHAPVTLVKGFEFACPYCERSRATLAQLRKQYGRDLKIVYKNFVVHRQTAMIPALAACAAHKQGKFEAMANDIWEKGYKNNRDLSRANMLKIAGDLGLRMPSFERDLDSNACKTRVRRDQAQLTKVGQTGTPSFFINGRYLSGARPIDQFRTLVDEELKKAQKSRVSTKRYYQHLLRIGKKAL